VQYSKAAKEIMIFGLNLPNRNGSYSFMLEFFFLFYFVSYFQAAKDSRKSGRRIVNIYTSLKNLFLLIENTG